jgi:hypothetical protein
MVNDLIGPFAGSIFIRNHRILMRRGTEGLASLLDAPLVSQESIDVMAKRAGRNRPAKGSAPAGGRYEWVRPGSRVI